MQGIFNKLLGIHPQALNLQTARAATLSSNLVNADTPNYKAQDIDFKTLLNEQMAASLDGIQVKATNEQHFGQDFIQQNKLYRTPTQASLDGNTVETHIEKSHFMENSLRYQVSVQLISGKFNGFIKALKGE